MEDLALVMPVVPAPKKTPRVRAAKGGTVKEPRSKLPKKPPRPKTATKRAATTTKNDSGGENFDIDGFTDLDD